MSNGSNDSVDCISINRTARVERKCRKKAKAIFFALPGQVNKWQQVLTLSEVREGFSRTGHTLTNAPLLRELLNYPRIILILQQQ